MTTFYRLQWDPPQALRPGHCAHLHSTPQAAQNCRKARRVRAAGGVIKVVSVEQGT